MNFIVSRSESLPLALPAANAGSCKQDAADLQIAGLAQWLRELPTETAEASINLRLARAESLRQMLDDADWSLPAGMRERGHALLAYLCGFDDLSADDVPLIGHLDDAPVIELSWSEFEGEVQDYQDYRRFCRESPARGSAGERRIEWERECLAEASALLHRQTVRERGYARALPASRPFRVC